MMRIGIGTRGRAPPNPERPAAHRVERRVPDNELSVAHALPLWTSNEKTATRS